MRKSTVVFTDILVLVCFLSLGFALFLGGSMIVFYTYDGGVMDLIYNIVITMIGASLAIAVIPQLISNIVRVRKKHLGKADLRLSLGYVLVGAFLICFGIGTLVIEILGASWVNSIVEQLRDSGQTIDSEMKNMIDQRFEQVLRLPRLAIVPVSLYLIIIPLIRTIRSDQRGLQYRVELYKPLLGALALFLTAFCVVIWLMEDDPVGITVQVLGCLMGVLAVAYFIAALAGLSKAVKAAGQRELQEAQSSQEKQCAQQDREESGEPLDLPFNLPAGVDPNDL